jgi:hypothetical protein
MLQEKRARFNDHYLHLLGAREISWRAVLHLPRAPPTYRKEPLFRDSSLKQASSISSHLHLVWQRGASSFIFRQTIRFDTLPRRVDWPGNFFIDIGSSLVHEAYNGEEKGDCTSSPGAVGEGSNLGGYAHGSRKAMTSSLPIPSLERIGKLPQGESRSQSPLQKPTNLGRPEGFQIPMPMI